MGEYEVMHLCEQMRVCTVCTLFISDSSVDDPQHNKEQQLHSIASYSGQTQYYSLHWLWLITSAYSAHTHTHRHTQ